MSSAGVLTGVLFAVMLFQHVSCTELNVNRPRLCGAGGSPCCKGPRQEQSIGARTFRVIENCNETTVGNTTVQSLTSKYTTVLIPSLYLIVFIFGLPANILALWILVRKTKRMPSTTLLVSLTVADILLILMLPFKIIYHFSGNNWIFGEYMCRLVTASFYGNMYASILCLTCISIDRYIALVHPFASKVFRSQKMAGYVCLVLWVAVIGSVIPFCIITQTHSITNIKITTCHDALKNNEKVFLLPYFISIFVVGFVLPLCIMLFCYGSVLQTLIRNQKKYLFAAKVTALVLVVFIVCFAPSNIILILHYSEKSEHENSDHLYYIYMLSLAISSFNSCLDPFIYYYVSEEFRSRVRSAFKCTKKSYKISDQATSSSQLKSKGTIVSSLDTGKRLPA
ncbi:proteinase-activated receptor 3 isoform X1 [Polypterus senegalus]|uniref:proteinase-activated receptor 3 isoform X1 n=1 Tax=Polypterus senegalus TaxID=55291 RepID=UPI001964019B|nr:proteinase-activated receptor 3 isoform X1 [Polypterus senegalus]